MNVLEVCLGDFSYPIHIGAGVMKDPELLMPHIGSGGALIVTNETIATLYLERLEQTLTGQKVATAVVPDGEAYKTLDTLAQIYDALIDNRCGRDVTIIALGGGVIGDMAGFAAATWQRGVRYVQIPTTLLAQVDSSVGGKTAVNHPRGKNMIGAFHQPVCVLADTETLHTLPPRDLRSGIAETIKYGLIRDPDFFDWMETHLPDLVGLDLDLLAEAIRRACQNKADVVAVDEREHGERALLNLGHTFGHAIETGLGHGQWLHGEAVSAGICMAADMSARMGRLRQDAVARINTLFERAGLPRRAPSTVSPDRFLELMAVDKKVLAGNLRLILLNDIGESFITSDFEPELLRATLEICRDSA
ncbi:MAG: 3-dehydroquinate synthase [Pseudomonadota bacterium]